MHEKQIDLGFRPGNLKPPTREIAFINRATIGKIGDARVIPLSESIIGVEICGTIGVIDIHQFRWPAIDRIAPKVVRFSRDLKFGFVKGGYKSAFSLCRRNSERDTIGLEEGPRLFGCLDFHRRCGFQQRYELGGSYAEFACLVWLALTKMRQDGGHGRKKSGGVVFPPSWQIAERHFLDGKGRAHCSDSVAISFQFGSRERMSREKVQMSSTSATASGSPSTSLPSLS